MNLEFGMNTFLGYLQLATCSDLDRVGGLVTRLLGHVFNLRDHIKPFEDLAEDNVPSIKPTIVEES